MSETKSDGAAADEKSPTHGRVALGYFQTKPARGLLTFSLARVAETKRLRCKTVGYFICARFDHAQILRPAPLSVAFSPGKKFVCATTLISRSFICRKPPEPQPSPVGKPVRPALTAARYETRVLTIFRQSCEAMKERMSNCCFSSKSRRLVAVFGAGLIIDKKTKTL